MEDNIQKLADAGQLEDSLIIHAAPGEMVVPPVISEQTQQMINQDMQSVGLNPAEYIVGQGSINNLTGLQEFGFLSKLFKKVKKGSKKSSTNCRGIINTWSWWCFRKRFKCSGFKIRN